MTTAKPGIKPAKSPTPAQRRGRAMEDLAAQYLTRQGLNLVQKNVRTKLGEIDLIMRDGSTLIFVEVRYRRDFGYGGGIESIDDRKINKITKAAQIYLQKQGLLDKVPIRFDVLAISGETPLQWTWIKQAFGP